MSTKPGNFNPEIHVTDYRKEFEAKRVGRDCLISIDGRATESLNGKWNFYADPIEYLLRGAWYKESRYDAEGREKPCDYDFEEMDEICVPSCWNMARPDLFLYENMGVYFRTFKYKKHEEGERLFLHFEGVAYRAYVFLNGECIAMHDGASTPFSVEITDKIDELGIKEKVSFKGGKGSAVIKAKPELWSPENPKLYDVSLSIDGDRLSDRIGFREFRVEGARILLNGKERFMKGICVHEDHIDLGKSTNESVIRDTIRTVKEELNGVFIRLAHYPHSRLFSKIADEMGVMLWEEIPVYWSIAFNNEKTYQDAENQLGELIKRDKNRASVVIWSVGNENPDTDERFTFMSNLASYAKGNDPTRAVGAACLVDEVGEKIDDRLAEKLDIIGINEYYGWYNPDFSKLGRVLKNSNPSKPVIITEVGAGARAGNHGTSDMLWSEEFQEALYKKQVKEIGACPFIKGVSPWILYDFRAQRRYNRYQQGFNRKGLIDSDRKTKKLAFKVLSDFYKTK